MIISSSFSFSAILHFSFFVFRFLFGLLATDNKAGTKEQRGRSDDIIFSLLVSQAQRLRRGRTREPFPAASVFWLMLSTDFGLVAAQNETECRRSVIWLRKRREADEGRKEMQLPGDIGGRRSA